MKKAGPEDVYITGTFREVHFMLSESLRDEDWRDLIQSIKTDYKRVAKEKSGVLKSLEKWVIFPNKFVEIAGVCADLHSDIVDASGEFKVVRPVTTTKRKFKQHMKEIEKLGQRANRLYRCCLELSLITPIFAEAFINMFILILCKKEIRSNERQFNAFIRSHIDAKIFDLPYKCEGFSKAIDQHSELFKKFKRVMDKRNHAIHGNVDPERERIETVYFEGKRPLFEESGDHVVKFFEALERRWNPQGVVKDYEDVYAFLLDLVGCLKLNVAKGFWGIMQNPYPGYDVIRKRAGLLFNDAIFSSYMSGLRYDDELDVEW